jgi:hypothetical protein
MHTRRFGRKLKLPSTVAIQHAILRLMVQDELKAQAPAAKAEEVLVAHGRGDAKRNRDPVLNTVQCILTNKALSLSRDERTALRGA